MKHLLTISDIEHIRNGEVIWGAKNLLNTFHTGGEYFILSALFRTTNDVSVPSFYYLGMDNRSELSTTDNMQSITTEPSGNGYSRAAVSSATGFEIESYTSLGINHWRAKSISVSFSASGGQWGPVSNVFITDRLDNTGYLISTASLGNTRFFAVDDTVNFKFNLKLFDSED